MTRKLKPATAMDVHSVELAIYHLKQARDAFKRADCPQSLRRVRAALRSAQGAQRHVDRRKFVTNPADQLDPADIV
jgi:hypothetical protein